MHRKGFPESYDRRALLRFLADVKSGMAEVAAPVYYHLDVRHRRGEHIVVRRPDILIVEGLNVCNLPAATRRPLRPRGQRLLRLLALRRRRHRSTCGDWYVERFLRLRETAFSDPSLLLPALRRPGRRRRRRDGRADLGLRSTAPTSTLNIAPTRDRASLVLRKGADHTVQTIWLRDL